MSTIRVDLEERKSVETQKKTFLEVSGDRGWCKSSINSIRSVITSWLATKEVEQNPVKPKFPNNLEERVLSFIKTADEETVDLLLQLFFEIDRLKKQLEDR